jgi:hypothetical protein
MHIPRVTVQNYENWGNLVKTWATGTNRFPNDFQGGVPAIPLSLDELRDQCAWAQVGIDIPPRVKGVQFIQSNEETLLIRLPPKAMLEDGEASIRQNPNTYPLPQFYKAKYGGADPTISNVDDALKFHASRIGEYTIAQCG